MNEANITSAIAVWLGSGSINIFGKPFAGKDTQGRRLADDFSGTLLGGGDILRASYIPPEAQEAMRTGALIPSKNYVEIVLPYLSKPEFANKPLILSSVGRWHGEEEGIIASTQSAGHPLKAVVYFELSDQAVIERWRNTHANTDRGNRHDDTEEILQVRLSEFKSKTVPVIEYYKNHGNLITISADKTPDEIYSQLLISLYNLTLV